MNVPGITLLDGSGEGTLEDIVTFRFVPPRMGRICDVCKRGDDRRSATFEVDWGAMVLGLCKKHAQSDWLGPYTALKAAGGRELVRSAYDTFGGAAL